jgi:hypothetical protein
MSYVRWGSKCQNTIDEMPEDKACPDDTCPGSTLYIFDHCDGYICCCMCPLLKTSEPLGEDFKAFSDAEMAAHLEEHVAAGHHVRLSVLAHFRRAIAH